MVKSIRTFLLAVVLLAYASAAVQRTSSPPIMPDPTKTPGDVLEVTKVDICVPGYTKKVRDVPESVNAFSLPKRRGRPRRSASKPDVSL